MAMDQPLITSNKHQMATDQPSITSNKHEMATDQTRFCIFLKNILRFYSNFQVRNERQIKHKKYTQMAKNYKQNQFNQTSYYYLPMDWNPKQEGEDGEDQRRRGQPWPGGHDKLAIQSKSWEIGHG